MSEFRRRLMMQSGGTGGKYIKFADPVVEQICMKWSSDGIGLTPEDAAKVTDIGTTFRGNTEITSFDEFAKFSVKTLVRNAMNSCSSLVSIDLVNVVSIGNNAFLGTRIANIGITPLVESIGANAFANTRLAEVNFPNLKGDLQYIAFAGCQELTKVNSLGSITSIGAAASTSSQGVFSNCTSLQYVNMPANITIGNYSFYGCSSLRSVDNINEVKKIGKSSFEQCSSLPLEVIKMHNLQELDELAFSGVQVKRIIDLGVITNLPRLLIPTVELVVVPKTVTSCANYALNGCSSLRELVIEAKEPFSISVKFISVADPIKQGKGYVYVPDSSLQKYKSATNWSAFADQIKPMSEYVESNE